MRIRVRKGDPDDEVRPRSGWIDHVDGTRTPLRYEPTDDDPRVFSAATADGKPVFVGPHDRAYVDVLGPGQEVVFKLRLRPGEE